MKTIRNAATQDKLLIWALIYDGYLLANKRTDSRASVFAFRDWFNTRNCVQKDAIMKQAKKLVRTLP